MTGIDRLRELAKDMRDITLWYALQSYREDAWGVDYESETKLRDTLREIADQIEREAEPTSTARVLAVIEDMERHCSGVEGMEDSPVARWAKELREAIGKSDDVTTMSAYDLLSERERKVLDMWPRFEGTGEPVMIGDEFINHSSHEYESYSLTFYESGVSIRTDNGELGWYKPGERVKRPEVLAADGKPIREGETLWRIDEGSEAQVLYVRPEGLIDCDEGCTEYPSRLTHEPKDSWKRWRKDAKDTGVFDYVTYVLGKSVDEMNIHGAADMKYRDLERRAKALCERGAE